MLSLNIFLIYIDLSKKIFRLSMNIEIYIEIQHFLKYYLKSSPFSKYVCQFRNDRTLKQIVLPCILQMGMDCSLKSSLSSI